MTYVPKSMSKLDTTQNMFRDKSNTFGVDSLKLWGQTISKKISKYQAKFKSNYTKILIKFIFKLKIENVAFSTAATV